MAPPFNQLSGSHTPNTAGFALSAFTAGFNKLFWVINEGVATKDSKSGNKESEENEYQQALNASNVSSQNDDAQLAQTQGHVPASLVQERFALCDGNDHGR